MIPVSVVVTTRNEELNIERCLRSVQGFVEHIFVIDSDSSDRTVEIARQRGAQVHNLPYEHGRIIPWIWQWGQDDLPIPSEWILILEADQEVTPELAEELQALLARPAAVVGIALPLGPLPTSPARALTGRCTAVILIRDCGRGRNAPPQPAHRRLSMAAFSAQGSLSEASSNACLQTDEESRPYLSAHRPYGAAARVGAGQIRRVDSDPGPVGPSS